jgi:hypothetical protein
MRACTCTAKTGLGKADMDALERIMGHRLDARLNTFLLAFYGKDGRWMRYRSGQSITPGDGRPCGPCNLCTSLLDDPLLFQLCVIIHSFKDGHFDTEADCYMTVRARMLKDDWRLVWDIPF